MSKSYWMTGQTGNFSNDGADTFDPRKRYVGVRLQQGVPLLDRDWNELEDIRRYEDVMLRKRYIGNGSPDNGFKISALDPPDNDFKIAAGRCLVDGFEAVNEPDKADHIRYSDQEGVNPLKPSEDSRIDIVYLDVWIKEVTSADDPALKNPDVNDIETCVRHKIEWRVRVDEGSAGHEAEDYHRNYDIAKIIWEKVSDKTLKKSIQDLRRTGLAVDLVQEMFGDVISTILKSNLPSDPEVMLYSLDGVAMTPDALQDYYDLVESGVGVGIHNFVDHAGNIWLFWDHEEFIWCRTYSAGIWGEPEKIAEGYYLNSFEDHAGNIWLFFHKEDTIQCMTHRAGRWGDPDKIDVVEGSYYNSFEDHAGTIWLFFNKKDTIRCMTYRAGSWGELEKIAGYYLNSFEDHAGNIWLFCQWDDAIVFSTYSAGKWGDSEPIDEAKNGSYRNSFEDHAGNIWLFFHKEDTIWCIKHRADRWSNFKEISGSYLNSFEDHAGNMWLFWSENDDLWCRKIVDVNEKLMDELSVPLHKGNTQLTTGTMHTYLNSFVDHAGNIWLLYTRRDSLYMNTWCKRYVDGDWLAEMRLNSGTTIKIYANSFEDHAGNIWLFWLDLTRDTISCWCKKCYTSL